MTTKITQDGSGNLFMEVSKLLRAKSYRQLADNLGYCETRVSRIKNSKAPVSDLLRVLVLRACPTLTIQMIDAMTKEGTV